MTAVIQAVGVTKEFESRGGVTGRSTVRALRGVDFALEQGGAASFIGESGCGKTTFGRILAGLESKSGGTLRIDGTDVDAVKGAERRRLFQRVQLVHQDPYSALNPSSTIEDTLASALAVRARAQGLGRDSGRWIQHRMRELLTLVGLDEGMLTRYPHKLSGGQRQRVCIARSLIPEPSVLVADEAVSMIDVSLRLGILNLFSKLRDDLGIALLFITHDVATARYVGQEGRVHVIYRGTFVEEGETDDIIQTPLHPYTQCLLSAVPVLRGVEEDGPDRLLPTVGPESHLPADGDADCPFARRCPLVTDACREGVPPLVAAPGGTHLHRCLYPEVRSVIPQQIAPLVSA